MLENSIDQWNIKHDLVIDINKDANVFEVEFENTRAFKWLKRNAAKYHFRLSFDKNHKSVDYEPWHWRYEGSIDSLKIFERANREKNIIN